MALMLAKTYAAFKAAGVDEDQAQAAAEELASFEGRFGSLESGISQVGEKILTIESRITSLDNRVASLEVRVASIEARVAAIEAKITVLMWAVGINVATTIAILGVLLHRG